MIQILAALSMFLDHLKHAGIESLFLMIIGRIAAVYYLMFCGLGLRRTKNTRAYASRLLLTALIYTYIYAALGFGVSLNVVYTMAFSAYLLPHRRARLLLPFICLPFDYSLAALAIIVGVYLRIKYLRYLGLIFLNGFGYSSIITLLIGSIIWKYRNARPVGPRYWMYFYYPLHLLPIKLIARS